MTTRRYEIKSPRLEGPTKIPYDTQLNAEQLAVVQAPPGPLLVLAGAGSGKTRTLIYRVARMLEHGIAPESVLLLTFTNRAAREMLSRAGELVLSSLPGLDPRRMWGGTFHHLGNRILREHAEVLGFDEGFSVLDRDDSRELVSAVIGELGLGVGQKRFPKSDVIADLYSSAINTQRSIVDVLAARRPQLLPQADDVLRVCGRYVERKLELNVMDFDDLLLHLRLLLTESAAVRQRLQERFACVLVDEYQDTNRLQAEIVDLLAGGHRNLTVVGDDAQSIYSFRGAELGNILDFSSRWPEAKLCKLTINYRSSPEILRLANLSIAANVRQHKKELTALRPARGSLPVLAPARDAPQQAGFIAQRILELRDEGVPLTEMAVLYRAHQQSLEIQIELARRKIPFVVRSGIRFFEQQHVKDCVACLRTSHNPADELAFKRAIKLFPGIGGQLADMAWNLVKHAARGRGGLRDALSRPELAQQLPGKARNGFGKFCDLWLALGDPKVQGAPAEAIDLVLALGYADYLRAEFPNAEQRIDDLKQLAEWSLAHRDLGSFLAEVSLLDELTAEEVIEGEEPDEKLTLSSVHQSKGLEWRAVFVAWLADGRFPSAAALKDLNGEEEERRCFYVAVTRAKDELYLCYPTVAAPRDGERVILRPSRFVEELPGGEGAPYERWQLAEAGVPTVAFGLPAGPVVALDRAALAAAARKLLGASPPPPSLPSPALPPPAARVEEPPSELPPNVHRLRPRPPEKP